MNTPGLESLFMEENFEWPCWKIMGCDAAQECPAKNRPGTPCWEIARELNDYRNALDICDDCIVHMLKAENPALSGKAMRAIMDYRVISDAIRPGRPCGLLLPAE